MHIYASTGPQQRLALRKAEKIEQSEMFSYYVEQAKKITEAEIKKSEHRHNVNESGIRADLSTPFADMIWDRYLDEIFENGGLFSGIGFNNNFLNYLYMNRIKKDEDELLSAASDKQLSDETVEGPVNKD